jgi:hypothetical protein
MQYAWVIALLEQKAGLPEECAMNFFYHSTEYRLMREGVGDLHCMSDDYLAEDLMDEWNGKGRFDRPSGGA